MAAWIRTNILRKKKTLRVYQQEIFGCSVLYTNIHSLENCLWFLWGSLFAELALSLAYWDGTDLSCEVNIVWLIKQERKQIQGKVGKIRGNKQEKNSDKVKSNRRAGEEEIPSLGSGISFFTS